MKRLGVPQFDYESFKQMYDDTPSIQDMVEFDPEGVTIGKKAVDAEPQGDSDTVGDMAKRAVDLKDL